MQIWETVHPRSMGVILSAINDHERCQYSLVAGFELAIAFLIYLALIIDLVDHIQPIG